MGRKKFRCSVDRKPYERQPEEPDCPWDAFIFYRDMGTDRTLRGAAQKSLDSSASTKTLAQMENCFRSWCVRWRWVERCREWDREIDNHRRKAKLAEVDKMYARFFRMGDDLAEFFELELPKWLKIAREAKKNNSEKPAISMQDLLKVADAVLKLQKSGQREPDSISEIRQDVIPDDERVKIRKLLEQKEIVEAVDSVLDLVEK